MTLFELSAVLSLDMNAFTAGVNNAETQIGGLRTSLNSLGSGGTGRSGGTALGADIANDIGDALEEGAEQRGAAAGNAWTVALGTAIGNGIGDLTGKAVEAVFDFTVGGVQLASQMQETGNVVETTFGASAQSMYRWADTAKSMFGMSSVAALGYAGTLGSIARGQGFSAEASAEMSQSLVRLAADFASFRNMDFNTTFAKVKSGMLGNAEAIDDLGINMHAAAIEEWYNAQVDGSGKLYKNLSEAEKYAARYQYIMEKAGEMGIIGDFSRNRDSFSNQVKLFQTNLEELQLTLGETLLPVMNQIITFFNSLFGGGGAQSAEEFGTSLTNSMSESYAQIEATADSAIGLINAMIALEEQGIDTDAEQSQWNALMQQLQISVSGVNDVLGDQATSIAGCKTALIEYIEQWRANQLEMARESAMQEYYTRMQQETADVVRVENELAVARAMAANREAEWAQVIGEARAHYGLGDEIDDGQVFEYLAQNAATDGHAQVWMDRLTQIDGANQRIQELERELVIEQNEVAELQKEIAVITQRMAEMDDAMGISSGSGSTTPKPDLPPINLTVTIEGSAVMDGQAVGHLMMPQINAAIRRQANAQMHVR